MDWVSAPLVSSVGIVPTRGKFVGVTGAMPNSETGKFSAVEGFGTKIVFRTSRRPLNVPAFRCGGTISACYFRSKSSSSLGPVVETYRPQGISNIRHRCLCVPIFFAYGLIFDVQLELLLVAIPGSS